MSQVIKGPLYYRINTNGPLIPVKSTGFMNEIAQVKTKQEAENRIVLGKKNGIIPNIDLSRDWTKNEGGKWVVTLENYKELANNKYEGPGDQWATSVGDYMTRRGGKSKKQRKYKKKTVRRRNKSHRHKSYRHKKH
jgi:hypothetical protein